MYLFLLTIICSKVKAFFENIRLLCLAGVEKTTRKKIEKTEKKGKITEKCK